MADSPEATAAYPVSELTSELTSELMADLTSTALRDEDWEKEFAAIEREQRERTSKEATELAEAEVEVAELEEVILEEISELQSQLGIEEIIQLQS